MLIDWLNSNLIIAQGLNSNGLGSHWLTLVPYTSPIYPNITCVDGNGNAMGVYKVTNVGANQANGMMGYVCDYTQHNVHSQTIDAQADYCFTPNMNGCTFAVSQPNNGQITVAHANSGGNSQNQLQQISNTMGGLQNLRVLEPSEYRRVKPFSRLNATTIGVRSGGDWSFYFQSWESTGGGGHTCYGVIKM